jgi:hypothetical protein
MDSWEFLELSHDLLFSDPDPNDRLSTKNIPNQTLGQALIKINYALFKVML